MFEDIEPRALGLSDVKAVILDSHLHMSSFKRSCYVLRCNMNFHCNAMNNYDMMGIVNWWTVVMRGYG